MYKTKQSYVLNHSETLGKEPVTCRLVKKYSIYEKTITKFYEYFFCVQGHDTVVVCSAVLQVRKELKGLLG